MKKMTKPNFEVMQQADVPQSRNGKHRHIVTAILSDVMDLKEGAAIKIPLEALKDTKENVRSALSRESKKCCKKSMVGRCPTVNNSATCRI